MEAVIRKWGNSPALRIPTAALRDAGFQLEQKVELVVSRGLVQELVDGRDGVEDGWFVAPDDLPTLLRGAAAVAYPSFEEGFGVPVVEALACGVPVVTSAGTVMAELAGGTALLADPHDPASIADALLKALAGSGPPIEARLACARTFSWDACAAAHAAVYRSLVP